MVDVVTIFTVLENLKELLALFFYGNFANIVGNYMIIIDGD